MSNRQFNIRLGIFFMVLFGLFWLWQCPGIITGKLTHEEIDHYLSLAEKQLPAPEPLKKDSLARIRVWAEADDGKPFYMLNLMRLHPQISKFPGSVDFKGTPQEANQFYEDSTFPLLLKNAGSAIYGSDVHGKALINIGENPALDDWSRMLVVRYPNRRAFLQLVGSPVYAKTAMYKFMALDVLLVPTDGDEVVPDPRAMLGVLLVILFLAIGWVRERRGNLRQA